MGAGQRSFYCFPHGGGSPGEYLRWACDLRKVRVCSIQLPSRSSGTQFLPTRGTIIGTALILSAIFVILYASWFSLYTLTVERFGAFLRRPVVMRRIEKTIGGLLIAFGIHLALLR